MGCLYVPMDERVLRQALMFLAGFKCFNSFQCLCPFLPTRNTTTPRIPFKTFLGMPHANLDYNMIPPTSNNPNQ